MSSDPAAQSVVGGSSTEIAPNVGGDVQEDEQSRRFSKSEIRHNMFCCISLDATYVMGWAEASLALVPLLVFLKASNTMIGFMQSLPMVGLVGVVLSPWITRRFRFKKWYMLSINFPMVGTLGVLGLVIVLSRHLGVSNTGLIMFVLAMVGTYHFLVGFVQLPAQEFIVSCIPMTHRGRMFGVGNTAGSIGAVGAVSLAGWILAYYPKPMSFGFLFMLMWLLTTIGFIFAIFAREKPTPVEKSPKAWSRDMLLAAWNNKPFMSYLLFYVFQAVISSIYGFVLVYAFRELKAPASMAAVISLIGQVARICSSSVGGILVDKYGPKRMIPYWPFVIIVPSIPLLLIHNIWGVLIYQGILRTLSSAFSGTDSVLQNSLPKPEHRAGLFTIFNLVANGIVVITPFAGYMCDIFSYRTMFLVGVVMAVLMIPFARWFASTLGSTPEAYS